MARHQQSPTWVDVRASLRDRSQRRVASISFCCVRLRSTSQASGTGGILDILSAVISILAFQHLLINPDILALGVVGLDSDTK